MIPAVPTPVSTIFVVLVCASMSVVAADMDHKAVPVFDLLAARTAQIESNSGMQVVYHQRGGRMAMSTSTATKPVFGQWRIDDNGDYCRHTDDESTETCYRPSMHGGQLQFVAISGDSTLRVRKLAPGDSHGLLGETALEEAACDCRLTARRRGARDAK